MRVILASASPRRRELLGLLGVPFEVDAADVNETRLADEDAMAYATRVASDKAAAVVARQPGATVIGADTIVIVDGDVLGKPVDAADARRMLAVLSGRTHEVMTAVCVVSAEGTRRAVSRTTVWMRPLTAREIAEYVAAGEPLDKAGAYAIQGGAARFVHRIEGDYSNVVGLPVSLVESLLGGV